MKKAITKGSLHEIIRLHRDGVDINGLFNFKGNRYAPLSYACYRGDFDMVKYLIDFGANVNGPQICDHSYISLCHIPIFVALHNNDNEMMICMLVHGADLNIPIPIIVGEHILFRAISMQMESILETLLQFGANLNTINSRGQSPLTLAVDLNYVEVTKILILYGSNIDFQNFNGMTALGIANSNTDITMLLLLEGANVNIKGYCEEDRNEHPLVIRCRYAVPLLYNGMHRDMVDLFLKFII